MRVERIGEATLYRFIRALLFEHAFAGQLKQHFQEIIDEAESFGLHEVPEYAPIVEAMKRATDES
jgi:hypothetical protein